MIASTITSKGQITIPKEIRDKFHLKTHDRLLFKSEAGRIIIKPVVGTILDIKGAFPVKAKINFQKLRAKMEKETAGKIMSQ